MSIISGACGALSVLTIAKEYGVFYPEALLYDIAGAYRDLVVGIFSTVLFWIDFDHVNEAILHLFALHFILTGPLVRALFVSGYFAQDGRVERIISVVIAFLIPFLFFLLAAAWMFLPIGGRAVPSGLVRTWMIQAVSLPLAVLAFTVLNFVAL